MNVDEIKNKCAALLKKTSLYSDEHCTKLCEAFEHKTYDMRLNFEFFSDKADKAKVFFYERGQLVCELRADETQVIYLITENVLYRIVSEIVMRDENLIKRDGKKYIDADLEKSLMNKAFEEIGGVYKEMHKQDFGVYNLNQFIK